MFVEYLRLMSVARLPHNGLSSQLVISDSRFECHSIFDIRLSTGPFRFETRADVSTFWLIFFAKTYPVEKSDRTIINAGVNVGSFSLYALLAAPSSKVIAIEPAPDSCERIRQLIREYGLENRFSLH
jgi:hypothetical protein